MGMSEAHGESPRPHSAPGGDEGPAPEPPRALDARGGERPAFVLEFPRDPELDRLVRAFEAGNYALLRSDAAGVAARATDPVVREAALELRRRIDPDPLARALLVLSVLLLVALTIWAYQLDIH